jgi:hypothetical protein
MQHPHDVKRRSFGGGASHLSVAVRWSLAAGVLLLSACGQHSGVAGSSNVTLRSTANPVMSELGEHPGESPTQPPSEGATLTPVPVVPAPVAVAGSAGISEAPTESAPPADPTESGTDPASEPPRDDDDGEPAAHLWGRSFASVRIVEDGSRREHADGASVLVNPYRRDGKTFVRWNGGCNTGGASVTITATRFMVADDGSQSAAYCNPESRMEQEEWFNDFMHGSPHWELADGILTLSHRDTVITFEERRWPPPWPPDRSD